MEFLYAEPLTNKLFEKQISEKSEFRKFSPFFQNELLNFSSTLFIKKKRDFLYEKKQSEYSPLKISSVLQNYNHAKNLPLIYKALNTSLLSSRIFFDDGSSDNSFEIMKNLSKKNDKIYRTNNLHEIRVYNLGINLLKDEVDVILFLQDDDIPPKSDGWISDALKLFSEYKDLGVLSGNIGLNMCSSLPCAPEFANFQSYNDCITWPLLHKSRKNIRFMYTQCAALAPLFVRVDFIKNFYPQFDTLFSKKGEPGILLDCDISFSAWENGWTSAVFDTSLARGVGGHGSMIGSKKILIRQNRLFLNQKILKHKHDACNIDKIMIEKVKKSEKLKEIKCDTNIPISIRKNIPFKSNFCKNKLF